MPYSTNDDLLRQISEEELAILTGDETGFAIDWDRVEYARDNADAMINSYMYDRFTVPMVDTIPPIVVWLSAELTVINLFQYSYSDTALPNAVVWRKIDAMKILKEMQSGKVSFTITGDYPPNSPLILSSKINNDRRFSDDVLDMFSP